MAHFLKTFPISIKDRLVRRVREEPWFFAATTLAMVALIGKMVLTRGLVLGHYNGSWGLIADASFIIILVEATWLIRRLRLRVGVLWAIHLTVTMVLLTTSAYASYFGRIWTPGLLALVGQVGEVLDSAWEMLEPVHWWYVADLPILVLFTWLAIRSGKQLVAGSPEKKRGNDELVPALMSLLIFVLVWVTSLNMAIAATDQHEQTVALKYGLFAYQTASLGTDVGPSEAIANIPLDDSGAINDEVKRVFGAEEGRRSADVGFGVAEGRDVIIVQFESLQPMILDREAEGVEISPNLNAFARESWFFPNMVGQTGVGNTADSEFIFNTALYPPGYASASIAYADKELPSLPKAFTDQGRKVYTFHTNEVEFWNRNEMYPALGFTNYYDQKFFGEDDTVRFGAPDEVLYDQALKVLQGLRNQGESFCAELITVTSHHPFGPLPDRVDPLRLGAPYEGTITGGYISSINYADRAFGEFIAELKRNGMWDDTVLIVFGDHFGPRISNPDGAEGDAARELLGRAYTDVDMVMVPMYVHLPGQEEGHRIDDVVGQIDIMPTVMDILGIDTSGTPQFGRSVFVTSAAPALYPVIKPLPLGSYVNEDTLVTYDPMSATALATPLSDPEFSVSATASETARVEDAEFLFELSEAYVRAQPNR